VVPAHKVSDGEEAAHQRPSACLIMFSAAGEDMGLLLSLRASS
jgi:hypothetical protein